MPALNRRVLAIGALALTLTVSASRPCQAQGWFGMRNRGQQVTPYSAYRPPYYGESAITPLFLGGYAGHNYGRAPHAPSPPSMRYNAAEGRPYRSHLIPWRTRNY